MKPILLVAASAAALTSFFTPGLAQQPAATAPVEAPKQMTAAEWREDLRFMAAQMERRHKNLYHTVTREQFAAAVADLDARIPSLQRHEIIVGMMRIAAMVGDGHTRVDPRKDDKFGLPSLPLKLYLFDDGLYVRAAAPEFASLVGAKIEAIGGVPVDEAIRRASEISARDNEMGAKLFVPLYLNMPHILHALKLAKTPDMAPLTLRSAKRKWVANVPAGRVEPRWPPDTDISLVTPDGWVDGRKSATLPLWLQEPLNYHRLIELPEQKALYVQLNMVAGVKDQTLGQFGEKIAQKAAAANPRAIVLDLRLNQGGNGSLRNPFVRQLIKAEDEDTRLFVLTRRGTFSASQFILDDLDRLSNAVFIGEPASSKPSSFGDAYRESLPNSGISIRSSMLWWQAGQNQDPWTWVDVATPLTFADYAAGRDPALEAALNYKPQPSLTARLLEAAKQGGLDEVRTLIAQFQADPANRYTNLRLNLLLAAEQLSFAKHTQEGMFLAEAVTGQFPENAEAFLVLALTADAADRKDVALSAARRTLELDPNNRNIRPIIEKLTAQ